MSIVGTGVAVYREWHVPRTPAAIDEPTVASLTPPGNGDDQSRLAYPSYESYSAVIARPLFSPTRRPPVPAPPPSAPEPVVDVAPPAPETPPPPAPIDFTLVGIVGWGNERVAIVQPANGAGTLRIREGGAIGGWTAIMIDADRAVFRNGARDEELILDFRTPAPPTTGQEPQTPAQ